MAIELDAHNTSAIIDRATLYHNMKQLNEAEKDYSKAIKLSPDIPSLYYNRAVIYINFK